MPNVMHIRKEPDKSTNKDQGTAATLAYLQQFIHYGNTWW